MIVLFMLGLAWSGDCWYEDRRGDQLFLLSYTLVVGAVCVVAYLISLVKKKLEK